MPLGLWTTYLGSTHLVSLSPTWVNKIKLLTEAFENLRNTIYLLLWLCRAVSEALQILYLNVLLFYPSPVRGGQRPAEHTAGV